MSLLPFRKADDSAPGRMADVNLRDLLIELARYGKPSIGMYSGPGWHCAVKMNTNTTGSSFEVASEFGIPDPLTAALQCRDRIVKALEALGARS